MRDRTGTEVAASPLALLVERDLTYRVAIAACLDLAGCQAEAVASLSLGIRMAQQQSFDLAVVGLPAASGRAISRALSWTRQARLPLILLVEAEDWETDQELTDDHGTVAGILVSKPFVPARLVATIGRALTLGSSAGKGD